MRDGNFKPNQIILDGFDYTVDEGSNSFIALRKVKWGENGSPRLDLRKYLVDSEGNEIMQKGCGMITEEGPHELTRVLVEQGYGHTPDLITAMRTRDDFIKSLVDNYLNASPEEKECFHGEGVDDALAELAESGEYDQEETTYDLEEEGIL